MKDEAETPSIEVFHTTLVIFQLSSQEHSLRGASFKLLQWKMRNDKCDMENQLLRAAFSKSTSGLHPSSFRLHP